MIGGMEIVLTSSPSGESSLKLNPEKAKSMENSASPILELRMGELHTAFTVATFSLPL
jgi:hypothetical protein